MSDVLIAHDHYHDIATAFAGARAEGRLHIDEMASGSAIAIPFVLVKGARAGKTFWINGQVHGNEITGIVAALDFVNGLDIAAMSDAVIVTATANPLGLDDRNFIVPQDVSNLDTVFPGDPTGFVSGRMAHRLF
ncbi:MAG: putative deacylase [Gammaproteobacteria bacterium]|jgi:predicted deacylase